MTTTTEGSVPLWLLLILNSGLDMGAELRELEAAIQAKVQREETMASNPMIADAEEQLALKVEIPCLRVRAQWYDHGRAFLMDMAFRRALKEFHRSYHLELVHRSAAEISATLAEESVRGPSGSLLLFVSRPWWDIQEIGRAIVRARERVH